MNSAELSTHKIIESKEFNTEPQKIVQDGLNKNISEGILQNLISEDLVNTSQTVKNEKMICSNTNDISNISLDLLNTNLAMCKAEDFPNLTSCTESKDMPNLLLTTVSKSSRKLENSSVISSKPLDIENISNKPSTNTAVEESIILKGNNANDGKSLVPRNTANPAVNIPVSSNTGNTRKKRKRCVIGWAE
ncbi:hypothetical protein WA026_000862 [Henosepilachna vigintioctopunctata]|uniref:Uncharacterized protein n=1 Tax=Henosepilachna vigintioctopunctata TaxID=420089 RepID=A0AAW1UZW6_9CUCU